MFGFRRLDVYKCAAVLDAFDAIGLVKAEQLVEPRELLVRIVSMLTKMIDI